MCMCIADACLCEKSINFSDVMIIHMMIDK